MTLTYRLVKGSALTFAEADGNISDLDGRITALGTSVANPIDTITISGNILTFHYTTAAGGGSDSVTIPTASWVGRGQWAPSTNYAVNDLVSNAGFLYLVNIAHTSQATFDPGYQIGGNDVYQFIAGPMGQTQTVGSLTTSPYTLQSTDNLKYIRCFGSGAFMNLIIPAFADVAIAVDSEVSFRQSNSVSLHFSPNPGVTLNVPTGFDASTNYLGAIVTIKKVDIDAWDIFGALTAL